MMDAEAPGGVDNDALVEQVEASLATFERDTAVVIRESGPNIHIEVHSDESGYRRIMIREESNLIGSRATAYYDASGRVRVTEATAVGSGREPMDPEWMEALVQMVFGPKG